MLRCMKKTHLILTFALTIAANLLLLAPLPHDLRAVMVLLVAGFLPGWLLVEVLTGRSASPPDWWERLLYSAGAGFTFLVITPLLLSYLPGGPTQWQMLLAANAITAALLLWLALRRGQPPADASPAWAFDADRRWLLAGALVLLVTAGLVRFVNLGYADFQGDEARAALRAAAVIQGSEDVLMLHKKGPTEILIPTALYTLTGHLTESTARLPFALANVIALFAAWYLGWRLFHPLAGWLAAMFLALDGYFIGFARIVQYQSIVFLMSILAVLLLYRLVRRPQAMTAYLTLAAMFMATGMLSHYEGALAAIPAAYLWAVLLWRNRSAWRRILVATAIAAAVGAALLAAFYVPYIVNPRFSATLYYLTDRRIGGSPPYNNLADVFLRTTLYSTTYYVLLAIGLTVAGMVRIYWQHLRRWLAVVVSALLLATVAITFWNSTWLTVAGRDWIFLPLLIFLAIVVLAPRLSVEERTVWLWFTAVMLLALFFTEKPRTHVYTFFMPWLLIAGQVLALGWLWLRGRIGFKLAASLGAAAAAGVILLFGNYAWQFFSNRSEVMLNYDELKPPGYWVTYEEPDDKARFGFPLNNGWKVIGELYRTGELSGYFDTSEKEAWVPAWYSRSIDRCPRDASWFFEIRNLEPFSNEDFMEMEHYLRQGFEKWGRVQVDGRDKMIIYKRTGAQQDYPTQAPNEGLRVFDFADYAAAFDENAAPDLPLTYPSVDPPIAHPLDVNFDNQIRLEGYDISYPQPLRPGDSIRLTLYWRALQPIAANYKVFNHVYAADGVMQAQRDGYPVCDGRETWRWDPGELITDFYDIPVKADAVDGLYPLYTGFYLEDTGERLAVVDESGAEIAAQWHVTDIRIGEE